MAAKDYFSFAPYNEHDESFLNIRNCIAKTYASKGQVDTAILVQKDILLKAKIETQRKDSLLGKWRADYDVLGEVLHEVLHEVLKNLNC